MAEEDAAGGKGLRLASDQSVVDLEVERRARYLDAEAPLESSDRVVEILDDMADVDRARSPARLLRRAAHHLDRP